MGEDAHCLQLDSTGKPLERQSCLLTIRQRYLLSSNSNNFSTQGQKHYVHFDRPNNQTLLYCELYKHDLKVARFSTNMSECRSVRINAIPCLRQSTSSTKQTCSVRVATFFLSTSVEGRGRVCVCVCVCVCGGGVIMKGSRE